VSRVDLFVTDIDGCLGTPFRPFDLERMSLLRSLVERAQADANSHYPLFTICSGRAYSYVECVVQVLAIQTPALFEAGGGMIEPSTMQMTWNPAFTEEIELEVQEIRSFLADEIVVGQDVWVDQDKKTQVGLIGASDVIHRAIPPVRARVEHGYPRMMFAYTPVSIDVVPRTLTKKGGIEWLCASLGIPLQKTAFIGDANGDIGGLETVGFSFAPANAAEDVKEVVSVVTEGAELAGVLEAYDWCARLNEIPPYSN
jgi:hydroxymethylpyrimidine pyrophosphatase-like HAD family hydrolase